MCACVCAQHDAPGAAGHLHGGAKTRQWVLPVRRGGAAGAGEWQQVLRAHATRKQLTRV
jgi:hypothetical protein